MPKIDIESGEQTNIWCRSPRPLHLPAALHRLTPSVAEEEAVADAVAEEEAVAEAVAGEEAVAEAVAGEEAVA